MFDSLKNQWNVIGQIGLWIMGIVAGFVLLPPLGGKPEEESIWKLTQFIVNLFVGLMLVLTITFKRKAHFKYWFVVTLIIIGLATGSFFSYMATRQTCTCLYYSKRVLIGTVLTESEDVGKPCENLLKSNAGAVEEIWEKPSIDGCRISLGKSYVRTVPLFAIALMSMLQTVYIATKKR